MHSHLCQCASRTRPFPFSSTPKLCSNSNTLSTTIFFSSIFAFSSSLRLPHFRALRTSNGGKLGSHDANDPALLRKPSISEPSPSLSSSPSMEIVESSEAVKEQQQQRSDSEWVDWEDQILEDTVPLVGFVRMILHSGKYESGDRLSQEHEKTILERLLPYHPEYEKKIGCGIDFITIGYHPDFENSRCLFIARKDGELVDFSYWKCIKGLIRKNYPLYADSFILRHFRRRKRAE